MPAPVQLLVFAQMPPPVHGQSVMVRTLIEGLPRVSGGRRVFHVDPRLSRDAADIGRIRPGKLFALLRACAQALSLRWRHGKMALYYVPAPAKRAALYRDWIVMLLCRPFFAALIVHWHAVGLGEWLERHALPPERWITQALLGRAALAIVLDATLASDAQRLAPRRIAVVPNGVSAPPAAPRPLRHAEPTHVVFIGFGAREKGLFDTLAAVRTAHARSPGAFRLTVAGPFASSAEQREFHRASQGLGDEVVRYVGPVDETQRAALLASADVFCLPTYYPHEGQPLALLEAMAADVPLITTPWRGIAALLPPVGAWLVAPQQPEQIADALLALRTSPPPADVVRAHFLAHFTREQHLAGLAAAITATLDSGGPQPVRAQRAR